MARHSDVRAGLDTEDVSANKVLHDAKGGRKGKFRKTRTKVPDGPACRIYGAMDVKKVTGNLHIVRAAPAQSLSLDSAHSVRRLPWDMGTCRGSTQIIGVRAARLQASLMLMTVSQ